MLLPAVAWPQDPAADAGADPAGIDFFERYVRPVFVEHCYSCHSDQALELAGNLTLDEAQGWLDGGDSGPAVVPGNISAGTLIDALRHDVDWLQMPPDGPLAQDVVDRIERWVAMGAPSPKEKYKPSSTAVSDPEAGKSHWAFQPLMSGPPPDVSDVQWPRSAIDRYILAKLEERGLQPNADASAGDLAKRIYVQLTGLLPTEKQLREFLELDDPQAVEQLVDRLLSSPAYSERFGRHWLDLARYADSNGLDENFLFREAWRYRNWVLQAVGDDLTFDRFLLEQLAGDLLPYDNLEQRDQQRIATGFLLVGPKVLLGNPAENQKMEIADEQLDTIGQVVLGQTLGCARCHDHKFDPVPTSDYYALAGIFTSTKVMQQRYMLGEQRVMERLYGLGEDGQELNEAYEAYWRGRPKLDQQVKQAAEILELLKAGDPEAIAAALSERPEAFAEALRTTNPANAVESNAVESSAENDTAQDATVEPEVAEAEIAEAEIAESEIADKTAAQEITAEQRLALQQQWLDELRQQLNSPPPIPPRAMIAEDREKPSDESIRLAGAYTRKGDSVPRGFLQVLQDSEDDELIIPETVSGRVELSQWLTDPKRRSGQLAARVLANRIWHQLFGVGLVRTVDNFGRTGEPPSHPELLDYLAGRLIDYQWSVKSLVREIVLSRTFAISSAHQQLAHDVEPENRLLWRYHRRRLDPETLRDSLLALAGQLDNNPMDSTVGYLGDQATAVGENKVRRRTDFSCRSVYLPVIRNDLPELFEIFDFADPHATTGARPQTMVPTQALFMMNSELLVETAAALASQLLEQTEELTPKLTSHSEGDFSDDNSEDISAMNTQLVRLLLERVLLVGPDEFDVTTIAEFIDRREKEFSQTHESPRLQAVTMACQAVLASSRFQFLE